MTSSHNLALKEPIHVRLVYRSFRLRHISALVISFGSVVLSLGAAGQNPLFVPPMLEGPVFDLSMETGTTQFYEGNATATAGYNGSILGPTLIMNSGEFVTLNVVNNLKEKTTTHWHGMHVAPSGDGGPHTIIGIGETWSPDFTVLDSASTMWYHPHLHWKTHEQVHSGLAGMILVRDDVEAAAGLPMTYGVDEFPLILQDRTFAEDNSFGGPPLGGVMLVNATLEPYLEVPAQMIRFRVINGSSERTYNLGVSDGRSFSVVGADGGLLEAPALATRIVLMPGERVDLVLDFSDDNGAAIRLKSYASELAASIPGGAGGAGGPGGPPNPVNGVDFELLEIRVTDPTVNAVRSLPENIWTIGRPEESEAAVSRTVTMTGDRAHGFTLDDQKFDHARIDQVILLDTVEVWTLENKTTSAHPFHIHNIQFFILDRQTGTGPAAPPSAHEAGKKDTVLVKAGETVRFITRFETHADSEIPYMYHCHILPHEDQGMMAQFIVVDPGSQLINLKADGEEVTARWSKNLGEGIFKLQSAPDLESTFNDVGYENVTLVDGMNEAKLIMESASGFYRLMPE